MENGLGHTEIPSGIHGEQEKPKKPKKDHAFEEDRVRFKKQLSDQYKERRGEDQESFPEETVRQAEGREEKTQDAGTEKEQLQFHLLNDELQSVRKQLQETHQQSEMARQQDRQQLSQWLESQRKAQEPPPGPSPQDEYFQSLGIDPTVMNDYRNQILKEADQRYQQNYQQNVVPRIVQQEANRFHATVAKLRGELTGFDSYFSADEIGKTFQQVLNHSGLQLVEKMNWEAFLRDAHKKADHPRLQKEYDRLTKELEEAKKVQSKDNERQQQKAQLKAVPKASASGTSTTSNTSNWKKDIESLPSKLSFASAGREYMKAYSRQR